MKLPTGNGINRPASRLFRATLCLLTLLLSSQTSFSAPKYKIEEFCSFPPASNESGPWAGVIFGNDGALYGTTFAGGAHGYGSAFRVTTNGALTTLVSFANTNGANPRAGLLLGQDGTFYGTTSFGGNQGRGTVFKLTTNSTFSVLVHFANTNGDVPSCDLVSGKDGALYGTTSFGGEHLRGTVFRLTTEGALTTLTSFDGTNGYRPWSNLIPTDNGGFYGTTFYGPYSGGASYGPGRVFRLSPEGVIAVLAGFAWTNGSLPMGKFLQGQDGALYGASQSGIVFRVTTNGALSVLAVVHGSLEPSPGDQPLGGLAQGSDGAFYGTASRGGEFGYGTVFRVTTNGVLSRLASFANTNGALPRATVVQGNDGAFYGTTSSGGSLGGGNVFRIVVFSHLHSCERLSNACLVRFSGVEGETYRLERSTNLSGPWLTLTNITLDATRQAQYLDSGAPATAAFYRTVAP